MTNRNNYPAHIARALEYSEYKPGGGWASVTELIDPSWQVALKRAHKGDLSRDVDDLIGASIGSAFHAWIEKANEGAVGVASEVALHCTIDGKRITGTCDQIVTEGEREVLYDSKTCKVYKVMNREFDEWEQQANVYAFMARQRGDFRVDEIRIVAVMLDWMPSKALQADYPPSRILVIPIRKWGDDECVRWLRERIEALETMERMITNGLAVECSPAERWERGGYAVMKGRAKRALRVLPTMQQAYEWMVSNGGDRIEDRPKTRVRCESYCPVADHCPGWQEWKRERLM